MSNSLQDDYIKKELLFGAQNYSPLAVVLKRGEGVYLWDVDGNKYLDMVSAYSAVSHGHSHPELVKTIKSRRSVRVFNEEKILEEDMRKCLELTVLAPNSSNLQPWEFYWVRSENKKEKLI